MEEVENTAHVIARFRRCPQEVEPGTVEARLKSAQHERAVLNDVCPE